MHTHSRTHIRAPRHSLQTGIQQVSLFFVPIERCLFKATPSASPTKPLHVAFALARGRFAIALQVIPDALNSTERSIRKEKAPRKSWKSLTIDPSLAHKPQSDGPVDPPPQFLHRPGRRSPHRSETFVPTGSISSARPFKLGDTHSHTHTRVFPNDLSFEAARSPHNSKKNMPVHNRRRRNKTDRHPHSRRPARAQSYFSLPSPSPSSSSSSSLVISRRGSHSRGTCWGGKGWGRRHPHSRDSIRRFPATGGFFFGGGGVRDSQNAKKNG